MNGNLGNEDGGFFSDDEFPDIADDEYQRLEQDAISFTQQGSHHSKQPDNVPVEKHVTYVQRGKPLTLGGLTLANGDKKHNSSRIRKNVGDVQQGPSDGTILDEDGLPLILEERSHHIPQKHHDETTQREQWRVNRFAQSHARVPSKASVSVPGNRLAAQEVSTKRIQGLQNPPVEDQSHGNLSNVHKQVNDEALRIKIAELTRERDELTTNLRAVENEVYVRRGEVANIRAKQSDEEKTHQRQMLALQKLKQEEMDKHTASLQAMKAENVQVASEIQFLKQELKEESRKARAYQRQLKERPSTDKSANVNTTPKRNHALRDGFDDDEMMITSPVKSGRKSKQNTPTANRKRKQPTVTEPSVQPLPLRFSGADAQSEQQSATVPAKTGHAGLLAHKDHATERHLKLVQKVTNFCPGGGQEVLLERLFKYSLHSKPKKTFGHVVLDAIARLDGPRLPGDLIQVFVDLWSEAKLEEYYVCIPLLVEVISYIIDQDLFVVDADFLKSTLPVIQSTIEINASARFRLMRKDHLNNPSMSKPTINPNINNTLCLELLHTIASLTTDDDRLVDLFWRSISTDFVLVMLNASQPIPDVILMMQILATSILKDTFGMICDAAQQTSFEGHICNRLCFLLWELPKPDADKPPYSQKEICVLRQETLNFISQLTLGSSINPFNPSTATNHGTKFLVNHPTAISRILRSVYDELATVYLMTPTQHLHVELVNTAVRILHFVLFSPSGRQTDWQSKINSVNGGAHKFRVVMTRLAYAEGTEPGIDTGIREDTIRMATELLEESVTPDEVEDLVRVFEGDGTSGRRTSALTSTQR